MGRVLERKSEGDCFVRPDAPHSHISIRSPRLGPQAERQDSASPPPRAHTIRIVKSRRQSTSTVYNKQYTSVGADCQNVIFVGPLEAGISSRKKAPYALCVFFFIVIGNFSFNPSASNPLSLSTRASSPASARSCASPVKNVIDLPLFPPRPISITDQRQQYHAHHKHD